MLTSKKIDALKPKKQQYKVTDGEGLYITVTPRGIISWRYNYKFHSKAQTKTYGQYPEIGIAKARLLHSEFKDELARGGANSMPTFKEVFEDWWKIKQPKLNSVKNRLVVYNRVDQYLLPKIGNDEIDKIRRKVLIDIVKDIDKDDKLETAHRIASLIREIFDYAVDSDVIEKHPANGLSRVLRSPQVVSQPCIPIEEAGELLRKIMDYEEPVTRLGLLIMAHTFVRTNEGRNFNRNDIKDEDFWVIPAEFMKGGKVNKVPHVVPLSRQVKALIKEISIYTGDKDLVIDSPARPNHPVSENTMLFALYRLGYKSRMTVHGFRALASTVLNQLSPFKPDVIERQLAHEETNDVRKAYNRAEYLDERVKLMQWYSDWLEAKINAKP
jgi:integrase